MLQLSPLEQLSSLRPSCVNGLLECRNIHSRDRLLIFNGSRSSFSPLTLCVWLHMRYKSCKNRKPDTKRMLCWSLSYFFVRLLGFSNLKISNVPYAPNPCNMTLSTVGLPKSHHHGPTDDKNWGLSHAIRYFQAITTMYTQNKNATPDSPRGEMSLTSPTTSHLWRSVRVPQIMGGVYNSKCTR